MTVSVQFSFLYTTGSSCTPRVPLGLCIQTIRMRSVCCLSVMQVLTVCSSDHLLRSGTSRSFSLQQSRQTVSPKTTDPIFHRSWPIAQKAGHLRAGHTLGYQTHSVETVIVARFSVRRISSCSPRMIVAVSTAHQEPSRDRMRSQSLVSSEDATSPQVT